MTFTKILLCLPLAALLAACGSSPQNNYYRLTIGDIAAPAGDNPSLGIGPIEVPAYLQRDRLVYAAEGNRVQVAATDHWAEPLDAGVQRVMAMNLAGLLNTQDVRSFPWHPRRAPDYGVKVTLLSLEADAATATLTAEWLVYRPVDSSTVQRRITRLQQPLGADAQGAAALPAIYSALLFELSQTIADSIRSHQARAGDSAAP